MSKTLDLLYVEDDFADAMLLQHAIHEAGAFDLNLESVRSLSDAKVKLAHRAYDLIVLDLRLPDSVSPAQTMTQVRNWAKDTPIVVLTGSAKVDTDALGDDVMVLDKNECFAGKNPADDSARALVAELRAAADAHTLRI